MATRGPRPTVRTPPDPSASAHHPPNRRHPPATTPSAARSARTTAPTRPSPRRTQTRQHGRDRERGRRRGRARRGARSLAAAFGLPDPSPSAWDATSFESELPDGSGLWVSSGGEWYYTGPEDVWPEWDCPEPDPADPSDLPECTPPPASTRLPDDTDAGRIARELLLQVGGGDGRVSDLQRDDWGVYVQVEMPLPGTGEGSGLYTSVGLADGGTVGWASGSLGTFVPLGAYGTDDLATAVGRYEDEMNAWAEEGDGPVEEFTVRIVSAEPATSPVWTPSDVLLLPHYRLVDSEGSWWMVLAVAERHILR